MQSDREPLKDSEARPKRRKRRASREVVDRIIDAAATMLSGHVDPKIMIGNAVTLNEFPAMFDRLLGPYAGNKVRLAPR